MAHPHNQHRDHKVAHSRVHHITKGYAHGGGVHGDEAADLKLIKAHVKKTALRMDGGRVKQRSDRPSRAKGGRTKHKGKTVINIVNAGHPGGAMPPPAGPPMLPPHPPMAAAPPVPPPGAPPAAPPMAAAAPRPPMPMPGAGAPPGPPIGLRRSGGRTYAKGGGVYEKAIKARPVDHAPGKDDGKDIGRGKVVTYKKGGRVLVSFWTGGGANKKARGGPVEAPHHPKKHGKIGSEHGPMTPNFHAGSGGGTARKRKIAFERDAVKRLP